MLFDFGFRVLSKVRFQPPRQPLTSRKFAGQEGGQAQRAPASTFIITQVSINFSTILISALIER
jgi:hypothetical protein